MELYNKSKKDGDVMAVKQVTATLGGKTEELKNTVENIYQNQMNAPKASGNYTAEITAYDDAGNIAVAVSDVVEVTKWHTPKTNWTRYDKLNYYDFNRIKSNLEWLHEKAQELWRSFDIEDMGADIEGYGIIRQPYEIFNKFERNLEIINKNILVQNYGKRQTFYPNGVFIKWDELNRIEGAILEMRGILDRQEAGLRRLPFRLGNMKGVKV